MNATDLYPTSDFLKASELHTARVAKISGWRVVEFSDKETGVVSRKIALAFENTNKEMVINKTQARALSAMTGSQETDDWVGLRIALTPSTAPNGQPTLVIGSPATEGAL